VAGPGREQAVAWVSGERIEREGVQPAGAVEKLFEFSFSVRVKMARSGGLAPLWQPTGGG